MKAQRRSEREEAAAAGCRPPEVFWRPVVDPVQPEDLHLNPSWDLEKVNRQKAAGVG